MRKENGSGSWSIPKKEMLRGVGYATKNAVQLAEDAKILYEKKRHASAIALGILAIEEIGKKFMLLGHIENNTTVDNKVWEFNFKKHQKKMLATVKYVENYKSLDIKDKEFILRLKNFLEQLHAKKMEVLYVNWNKQKMDWEYFNDPDELEKLAREVMTLVDWLIIGYKNTQKIDTDLLTMKSDERDKKLKNKEIYFFCEKCARVMIGVDEFKQHGKICSDPNTIEAHTC